jgi:hypothetical protein
LASRLPFLRDALGEIDLEQALVGTSFSFASTRSSSSIA